MLALSDLRRWPVPSPWTGEASGDSRTYALHMAGREPILFHVHPLESAFRHTLDLLRRAEESGGALDAAAAAREIERELAELGKAGTDFGLAEGMHAVRLIGPESRDACVAVANAWMMATFQMLREVWRRLQAPAFGQDSNSADGLASGDRIRLRGLFRDAHRNGQIVRICAGGQAVEDGIVRVQTEDGGAFAVKLENIERVSVASQGMPFPLSDQEQATLAARCAEQWAFAMEEARIVDSVHRGSGMAVEDPAGIDASSKRVQCSQQHDVPSSSAGTFAAIVGDGKDACALQTTGSSTGQSSSGLGQLDLEAVGDALEFLTMCTEAKKLAMGDKKGCQDAAHGELQFVRQVQAQTEHSQVDGCENGSKMTLAFPEVAVFENQPQAVEIEPLSSSSCAPQTSSLREGHVEGLSPPHPEETERMRAQLGRELEEQRLQSVRCADQRVASLAQSVAVLRIQRDTMMHELARKRSSNASAELTLKHAKSNIAKVQQLQQVK